MGMLRLTLDQRKKNQIIFSCLYWNINSILAHNKLTLLQPYNTIHQYDILCISETYLDSSVLIDDTTLSLPGFNLVWSDHISNVKRGGVCLHYKESLSWKIINVSIFSQCLLCEVVIKISKSYSIVMY